MARIAPAASPRAPAGHRSMAAQAPSSSMIVVGKDVLELLSSAMYVDPLSIYREYVQNAADAIDQARVDRTLAEETPGRVDITVDAAARRIVIRDNGAGIPVGRAAHCLLAIGASAKRGTRARGFRGVGRLAGLAYGRALIFRTRSAEDDEVIELRWDCQRLKAALRDVAQSDDISAVIQRVVTITRLDGAEWPSSFFEVELSDVIRTKLDALLSPTLVGEYLEQVAPLPFASEFGWGEKIAAHLKGARLGNLDIRIGDAAPLRRPLRDTFKVTEAVEDSFGQLELLTLTDLDGGVAGLGWVLHHGYRGSITIKSRVGGVRCRVGNVQVGDENLLEEIFPEARFNGWTVGEVHVLDPRIVPNARRDHFEQNVHFSNLTAQLEPFGRQVAKRARSASVERNNARRAQQDGTARSATDPLSDALAVQPSEGPTPSSSRQISEVAAPLGSHTPPQPIAAESGRLNASQQRLLRKIRSLVERSGMSVKEFKALVDHL